MNDKIKQEIDYFIAGPDIEANRVASAETTLKICKLMECFLLTYIHYRDTWSMSYAWDMGDLFGH